MGNYLFAVVLFPLKKALEFEFVENENKGNQGILSA